MEPLRASAEYAAIRDRLADGAPLDAWQEDGLHFFVFGLAALPAARDGAAEAPVAVFAMDPASPEPVSAVVVTPRPGGAEAEVQDLRGSGAAYAAPLPP